MRIVEEVSITNYKGIRELSIDASHINIIVGRNNTGKSSILEAIGLTLSSLNGFKDSFNKKMFDVMFKNKSLRNFRYLINLNSNAATLSTKIHSDSHLSEVEVELKYFKNFEELENNAELRNLFLEFLENLFKTKPFTKYLTENFYYSFETYPIREYAIELELLLNKLKSLKKLEYHKKEDALKEKLKTESYISQIQKKIEDEKMRIKTKLLKSKKLFIITRVNKEVKDVSFTYFPNGPSSLISLFLEEKEYVPKIPFVFASGRRGYSRDIFDLYVKLSKAPEYLYETLNLIKERIPYVLDIRQIERDIFVIIQEQKKVKIPIQLMGDGFINLVRLAFITSLSKNGVALLEEPETTLHPGFMNILAEDIVGYSNYTQFFLTTHSSELLEEILEVAKEKDLLDNVNIIRVFKQRDLVDREILSGSEALDEITTIKTDLRGY